MTMTSAFFISTVSLPIYRMHESTLYLQKSKRTSLAIFCANNKGKKCAPPGLGHTTGTKSIFALAPVSSLLSKPSTQKGESSMACESLIFPFESADPSRIEQLGAKGSKLVEDHQHIRE